MTPISISTFSISMTPLLSNAHHFAPARLAGPLSTQLLCPHKRSLPDLSSGSHGIRQPNCNLLPSSLHHSSLALGTLVLHHSGGLRAMTQTVIRTIRNCCVRLKIEDPTSVLRHANSTHFRMPKLTSRKSFSQTPIPHNPYPHDKQHEEPYLSIQCPLGLLQFTVFPARKSRKVTNRSRERKT